MPSTNHSKDNSEPFVLGLSPDAAARAASVSRRFIFLEMAAGRLPSKKVGRRRIIPASSLRAWLAAQPDG